MECTYGYNYSGENDKYSYTEYVEDEDSDDSFSIQRRAFLVEGEPDFDAGPPEDGLEYLRRVRYFFYLFSVAVPIIYWYDQVLGAVIVMIIVIAYNDSGNI